MIADELQHRGHAVQAAGNGAAEQRPEAIILRLRLPVLDGWGFVER